MGLDLTVTHRKLSLDSPADSITGWYTKSFSESNIDMHTESKNASPRQLPAGLFVRHDHAGRTPDPVWEGDEIQKGSDFYEIKTVLPADIADSFLWRDCGLVHLPFHGKTYPTTTPSVKDARYNTKDYWDEYLSAANLQNYGYIVCYSDPDYPLTRVFNDKNIALIFTVDYPNSKPLLDSDLVPSHYEEAVTTHVFALDTELAWLGEHELRRIVAENPEGSQRGLETLRPVVHEMGSTKIYDIPVVMNYVRDIT